jgi:hypothetical protein
MNRREFLSVTAAAAQQGQARQTMIGIQVGAVSFVDEGVEAVLDLFRRTAHINTIFLAVFTYGRGIAGRQVPGQPLPDHGKQEYDLDFHGGNYATVHPQFYRDTGIRPEDTRAPDHGDLDIVAAVLPEARKRGMKTILWAEDVWRNDIPKIDLLREVDLHGRRGARLCLNNPYYRNFLLGLAEDYTRSYEIDGIMWGSERQGALGNALSASHGGEPGDPGRVGCFCPYCEAKARRQGRFDFARVREAFLRLEAEFHEARAGRRAADGQWVAFWRLLMRWPELLAWEQFWHDSLRETYAAIYERVKSVRPEVMVGWHIWHNNSFSPLYRAQQDVRELAPYSDFLKMVMYHNCAGERMAGYIRRINGYLFADFTPQETLDFHYRVMNYREKSLEEIPRTGFSADYVARETRRALAGAAGTKTRIWPGIDIDIPTAATSSKSTPEGTKQAVLAALRAGAHGVLLSRKYSEMRLANLRGAGEAIEQLGLA